MNDNRFEFKKIERPLTWLNYTPLTGFALERRRQQNLAKMEKDTITDSDFSDLFSDF